MRTVKRFGQLAVALAIASFALLPRPARAGSITVMNPGFESTMSPPGGPFPAEYGWMGSGNTGLVHSSYLQAAFGLTTASGYVGDWVGTSDSGGFYQHVGGLTADTTYVLSALVGVLHGVLPDQTMPILELRAGDVQGWELGGNRNTITQPDRLAGSDPDKSQLKSGEFVRVSRTFVVPQDYANAGQELWIALGIQSGPRLLFDDVTLTATSNAPASGPEISPSAAPLPSAAWAGLTLLGGLGAARYGRRRARPIV